MTLSPAELDRLAEALADRLAARLSEGPGGSGLVDVHGAAEVLNCSVPTIERARRRGEIPSIRVGRLRRYRRADLLALGATKNGGADHA